MGLLIDTVRVPWGKDGQRQRHYQVSGRLQSVNLALKPSHIKVHYNLCCVLFSYDYDGLLLHACNGRTEDDRDGGHDVQILSNRTGPQG